MKVYRMILLALVIIASANLSAQNATKAELNALTQRVAKLEADLERVITENVNLVEQLNIKTVTSYTDANQIKWDIVKVVPNELENNVVITLRLTNVSGVKKGVQRQFGEATDTNSNLENNKYEVYQSSDRLELHPEVPVNTTCIIKKVPTTSSYIAVIELPYYGWSGAKHSVAKFTGVHIPW